MVGRMKPTMAIMTPSSLLLRKSFHLAAIPYANRPVSSAPVHMHGEHDMNKGGPQQSSGAMVTPLERLGDHATQVDCPYCKRPTMTRVVENDSTMTMSVTSFLSFPSYATILTAFSRVTGVVLCLICVCLACVPCIAGWFQEIDHFCTQCGKQLTHRPSDGPVQIIAPNNVSQVPSQYHGQSYEMSQQSQMQYSQQHNPEHNPQQNKRQNQQQAYK